MNLVASLRYEQKRFPNICKQLKTASRYLPLVSRICQRVSSAAAVPAGLSPGRSAPNPPGTGWRGKAAKSVLAVFGAGGIIPV